MSYLSTYDIFETVTYLKLHLKYNRIFGKNMEHDNYGVK